MRAPAMRCCRLLLALFGFFVAANAIAHRLSPAFFGLTETEAGAFDAQWKVSIPGGLADALEPRVPEGCAIEGDVRSSEVNEARVMHASIRCDGPLANREFTVDGLASTDTDVLLQINYLDGGAFAHRLVPQAPSVLIPAAPGRIDVARTYFWLGIEHILIGIDHLLFVFSLLLLVRGVGRLLATITAFTVAHSVTLGAATMGWAHVPGAAVEATIALSILFLATELARRHGVADTGRPSGDHPASLADSLTVRFPWVVAFLFGLLHGFGFAGALSEIGLPAQAVPFALLFFNLGVEAGQVLFVLTVLALIAVWKRIKAPAPVWLTRSAAYVIGSVAAFWVFERTLAAL